MDMLMSFLKDHPDIESICAERNPVIIFPSIKIDMKSKQYPLVKTSIDIPIDAFESAPDKDEFIYSMLRYAYELMKEEEKKVETE